MKLTEFKNKYFSITGIYKIINCLNGHSYIGQAKNITVRIKEHLRSTFDTCKSDYNVPIHIAIRKYGIDNFDLEVLEKCSIEELDLLEQKWIKQEHTCKLDNLYNGGYNLTYGGYQAVSHSKLSETELQEIFDLLKDNKISIMKISKKFNISKDTVSRINRGIIWHNANYNYPIRGKCLTAKYKFNDTCLVQIDPNTDEKIAYFPTEYIATLVLANTEKCMHIGDVLKGKRKTALGYKWETEPITKEEWENLIVKYLTEINDKTEL